MAEPEPPNVPNGKWGFYAWVIRFLFHTLGTLTMVALIALLIMAGGRVPILQKHQVELKDPVLQLDPKTAEEFRQYHARLAEAMAQLNAATISVQHTQQELLEGEHDLEKAALRQSITLDNLAQIQSKTDQVVADIWRWAQTREQRNGRNE